MFLRPVIPSIALIRMFELFVLRNLGLNAATANHDFSIWENEKIKLFFLGNKKMTSTLTLTIGKENHFFYYQHDGYMQYEIFVSEILELYKTQSYTQVKQNFKNLGIMKSKEREHNYPMGISWILELGYIPSYNYVDDDYYDSDYNLIINFNTDTVELYGSSWTIISKRIFKVNEEDLKYTGEYINKLMQEFHVLEEENSEQFNNLREIYVNPILILEGYKKGEGINVEKQQIEKPAGRFLNDKFIGSNLEYEGAILSKSHRWREYVDGTLENSKLFRFDIHNLNPEFVYITGFRIAGYPEALKKIPELRQMITYGFYYDDQSYYDDLQSLGIFLTEDKIRTTPRDQLVETGVIEFLENKCFITIRKVTMNEALSMCY